MLGRGALADARELAVALGAAVAAVQLELAIGAVASTARPAARWRSARPTRSSWRSARWWSRPARGGARRPGRAPRRWWRSARTTCA
ncbi:MAG TPA: hypothetical protein VN253_29970, partial [Kofleriaceae bacterium]|nr:hypothetical protein [Kofleriaceae bacterium]